MPLETLNAGWATRDVTTTSDITIPGAGPAKSGGESASTPPPPKYINEVVHILAYLEAEIGRWGRKWASRAGYLDHKNILDGAGNDEEGVLVRTTTSTRFLSDLDLAKYTEINKETEKAKYKYTTDYRYEIYHPVTFTNNAPDWFGGGSPSLYSTGPYAYRTLDPLKTKQIYADKNDKVHRERLEIAAKAALMLYRTPSKVNPVVATINQGELHTAKQERNTAQEECMEAQRRVEDLGNRVNYTAYYSAFDEYKEKQRNVADIIAPGFALNADTFSAVAQMRDASDKLHVTSFGTGHHNASCYGLWGKWYTRGLGFHRGIDITFGENTIIYAICDGVVMELEPSVHEGGSSEWSYLTVQIDNVPGFQGQYLTYMHAGFETFSVGDPITLGQKIGVEKDYMDGERSFHTHIELNSTYRADGGVGQYSQTNNPTAILGSLSPYGLLEQCFQPFYDSVVEANR